MCYSVVTKEREVNKMKKTNKMATIGQLNRMTGNYTHIERRVFEDENGFQFVKINGGFTSITWLATHGRMVDVWF